MDDILANRIRRMYAALNETVETDVTRIAAVTIQNEHMHAVFQDFSGDLSPEQMMNLAQSAIALVAGLRHHLSKSVGGRGGDTSPIADRFKNTRSLQITYDLWNNEKHGYPPRHGSDLSKIAPQLATIRRDMVLRTQPKKGSTVAMFIGRDGKPQIRGDGQAFGVITGDVVDGDGNHVYDLDRLLCDAVDECERLFVDVGVALS